MDNLYVMHLSKVYKLQVNRYFSGKTYFAENGIQTHDLPTHVFLPGILAALIKSTELVYPIASLVFLKRIATGMIPKEPPD